MKYLIVFFTAMLFVFHVKSQELNEILPCSMTFIDLSNQFINTLDFQNQGLIRLNYHIETSNQVQWDYLNNTTTLQDFYSQYGPSGENKVRLLITGTTDDSDYGGMLSCFYGDGCPPSLGDWSQNIPLNAISVYDIFNTYIITCETEETLVNSTYYTSATALMPDSRSYTLSAAPTLLELQNLIALHDSLDGENNANLMYTTTDNLDHCAGQTKKLGRVILSNNGHNTLTQATIGLGWNGVLQDSFSWEGSIEPYHLVNLDSIPNTVEMDADSGHIELYVLSVNNGQTDPEAANDTLRVFSKVAVDVSSDSLVLEWKTLNLTHYSYIDIVTEEGEYLFSVGDTDLSIYPFQSPDEDTFQNHTLYRFPVNIEGQGEKCLKLRGYDYTGGKLGEWVRLYAVEEDAEVLVAEMSEVLGSDHYDQRSFYTTFPAPVPTHDMRMPIAIRPNPSNGEVWVSGSIPKAGVAIWQVCNSLGQVIATQTTNGQAGATEAHFDTALWPDGVYFVTLQHEQAVATEMLRVQH